LTEAEKNLKNKLTPEALNALYKCVCDDSHYWEVLDFVEDLYILLDVEAPWLDPVTPIDKLDQEPRCVFESLQKKFEEEEELKQKKIIAKKKKMTDFIQTKFGNFEL